MKIVEICGLSDCRLFQVKFPDKYDDNIFYLMPFYHTVFTGLDKLVVVDADVRFRTDPADIFDQFETFSDKNVVGVGNDLAPHYYQGLKSGG
jgi:hypothetical protein